ncbi:MAG: AAA family ATPase, partial [Myxococcales bacterium]
KTLLAKALARALGLRFGRVQFTPDLMPSDILGTSVWRANAQEFALVKGPVFTEILLADEINRTPPRTQAALLEAMEERQVTIEGQRHALGPSFFVIATQNPLELEGTYPLPEAQTDRFLMKVRIGYPAPGEEVEILRRAHRGFDGHDLDAAGVQAVVGGELAVSLQRAAAARKVEESLFAYIAALCRTSRESPQLRLGASPRAGLALLACARAAALLAGRDFVVPDDVKAVAPAVLRHRLVLRGEAELEGVGADDVVAQLLAEVEVPR